MTLLAGILAAATLLALPRAAQASYNPEERDCKELCLTSFHWCSMGIGDDSGLSGCSYPENAYPKHDRQEGVNPAMLLLHKNYTITWKNASPKYPMRIQWSFPTLDSDYDVANQWETTTNDTSYVFNAAAILDTFPTELAPNMSKEEATARVTRSTMQVILISQPEEGDEGGKDGSQQFILQADDNADYIEAAVSAALREERRKWQLGVGISVGLGLPLVIGAITAWFLLKSKNDEAIQYESFN